MRERVSSVGFWLGLVVALVALAVVFGGGRSNVRYDPRSAGPEGTKALAELLAASGASVTFDVGELDDDHEVGLVLRDRYSDKRREALLDWVERGGRLVVADPASPLVPEFRFSGTDLLRGRCTVAALADVNELAGPGYVLSRPASVDESCFSGAIGVSARGEGVIVAIGGQAAFQNAMLGEADNAVLAVSLLAPRDGTRVGFVDPSVAAAEEAETISDLIPMPVWVLLVQLGVAFVLYALYRARRLGAPVPEPVPVSIEGSELAAARGRLLQAMRAPDAAADALRADARRWATRRFGLPRDTNVDVVAARVAAHTTFAEADVADMLAGGTVAGDADLVNLSTHLGALRAQLDPTGATP